MQVFDFRHAGRYSVCLAELPSLVKMLSEDCVSSSLCGQDAVGRLSTNSRITLSREDRDAAGIPQTASHFAYVYPLQAVCEVCVQQQCCTTGVFDFPLCLFLTVSVSHCVCSTVSVSHCVSFTVSHCVSFTVPLALSVWHSSGFKYRSRATRSG